MKKASHSITRWSGFWATALPVLFTLTLAASPSLRAALPTWGTATTIAGDADVLTSGSLVYAYNFGAAGVPSVTLNGVTFSSFDPSDFGGNVSITLAGGLTATNSGAAGFSSPFTSLSLGYQELLQSNFYVSGGADLSLNGLVIGRTYAVQFWSNYSTSATTFHNRGTTFVSFDDNGSSGVVLDTNTVNAGGGVGQWAIGTFTATATNQTFQIHGPNSGSGPIVTALQLRFLPVPEPSVYGAALAALLGGVVLLRRRA